MPFALLSNWKFILAGIVGLALLGLSIAVWVQTERVQVAKGEAAVERKNAVQWQHDYEQTKGVADANAAALEEYKAKYLASQKVADDTRAQLEKQAEGLGQIRKELAHASAQDDGPIAPVLRYVLDRLRRAQADTACAGSGDPKGGGVPTCARGTVVVRSATGRP